MAASSSRSSQSAPDHRRLVLVTNDDGIDSPGLLALARALEARGQDVLVAAPATNMSGASAGIGPTDRTFPPVQSRSTGCAVQRSRSTPRRP